MKVSSAGAKAMATELGLWTSERLAQETGLSYRMIDYYTRRGLIKPVVEARGSGSGRLWDAATADLITDLRRRIEACPFHPHDGGST